MSDLKLCSCGAEGKLRALPAGPYIRYVVKCLGCGKEERLNYEGVLVSWNNPEEAEDVWNRRNS